MHAYYRPQTYIEIWHESTAAAHHKHTLLLLAPERLLWDKDRRAIKKYQIMSIHSSKKCNCLDCFMLDLLQKRQVRKVTRLKIHSVILSRFLSILGVLGSSKTSLNYELKEKQAL